MRMTIPLGYTDGMTAGDALPLVEEALITVKLADGSTQVIKVTGPTPGVILVERPEPELVFEDGPQPAAIVQQLGILVELRFTHATNVQKVKPGERPALPAQAPAGPRR